MKYTSKSVRQKFFDFMESKGHTILPSASIVPKEDPTVLYITAGMQPLVPYLLGQPHPGGTRLANSQKCLRTVDIDEVGDNRHLSFFEMLGSWSLGDYFKQESVEWGWEFLTSPEYLGVDPNRLFVTVYKGDGGEVEADNEAIKVWEKLFEKAGVEVTIGDEYDFSNDKASDSKYLHRIMKRSGKDNWWGLPYRGPCGPCSEIYYLLDQNEVNKVEEKVNNMDSQSADDFIEDQIVEIWNHVFMQYEGEKTEESEPKDIIPLASNNIDTGMGFERLLVTLNGFNTVYETDVLAPIVDTVDKWATK